MKKRIFWTAACVAVLILGWFIDPMGAATKTAAYLETVQTFTALKTFSGGLAVSGSSTTIDLGYDYTMATPAAPSRAAGPSSGGTCRNDRVYRFYVSWQNKTGKSMISAASADFTPSSGTTNKVTVTRPTIDAEATSWDAWFSDSTEAGGAHTTRRSCNVSGETNSAVGTTTFDCQCRTTNGSMAPSSNTSRRVAGLYFSKDYVTRPETTTKDVCDFGCEFSDVASALASITDASTSKRYVVRMIGPYSTGNATMKSYVSLVGTSRSSVIVGNVAVPDGVTEVGLSDFTTSSTLSIGTTSNTTDGYVYINDVTFGSASAPISGNAIGINAAEKWHVYANGLLGWTTCGGVYVTDDSWYDETASLWFMTDPGSGDCGVWRPVGHGGHGTRVSVRGSRAEVTLTSLTNAIPMQFVFFNNSGGNAASKDSLFEFVGVSMIAYETDSGRTAQSNCVAIAAEDTDTTFQHRVRLYDTRCEIQRTSSSGTLTGISIPACSVGVGCTATDSHSNWTFEWHGGEIVLSGGANRYDMQNLDTVATGLYAKLVGVRHAGTYNGTGTMTVEDSPLTNGTARSTPLAAAPATCSIGDHYIDTSGADCACSATNTWSNTIGTGSCV